MIKNLGSFVKREKRSEEEIEADLEELRKKMDEEKKAIDG